MGIAIYNATSLEGSNASQNLAASVWQEVNGLLGTTVQLGDLVPPSMLPICHLWSRIDTDIQIFP
jgi:hypothetical protein